MPRIITQLVFQPWKDINKTAFKQCHVAFHFPQQVISVHGSLVH